MRPADFTFKQFAIWHDQCAMKVNTDGILLGAWTQLNQPNKILDIGTGTGLIALMLAQRSQVFTHQPSISAVEIEDSAFRQAKENIQHSSWHSRLYLHHNNIVDFANDQKNTHQYDCLVSNPPYFSNSLKAPDDKRNLARHNATLSFDDLLSSAEKLATNHASFSLILPSNEAKTLLEICPQYNWFLHEHAFVSTVIGKSATRSLLKLSRSKVQQVNKEHFAIRNKNNLYTAEYINLCREFYLAM